MKAFLIIALFCSTVTLPAKGPPNDNFSDAIAIPPKIPAEIKGSLTDKLDRFRATKQADEPDHAGRKGAGSVWYSWTPNRDLRVQITAQSSTVDLLLAVYTGSALDNLTLIHRYENFAFPAFSRKRTEPFTHDARVEFEAKAGTTYFFALDTENQQFSEFVLKITPITNPLKPEIELLAPGSTWEFLLATDESGVPVDPVTLDPDFYHTWMFPKRYNGPRFLKGRAPLGYGEINSYQIKSNLLGKRGSEPPKNKRFTSYLRTSFTPFADISAIGIEGLIDDGIIAYINGKEILRMNVSPEKDPQDWMSLATHERFKRRYRTEYHLQYGIARGLSLPANVPVELSISLHNVTNDSTDCGFDIRLFSLVAEGVK